MPKRQGAHHGSGARESHKADAETAAALHRPLVAAGGLLYTGALLQVSGGACPAARRGAAAFTMCQKSSTSLVEQLVFPVMQELPRNAASSPAIPHPLQGLGMPMAGMPGPRDTSARHLMQMQMQGMNLQQMQGMGITGASRCTVQCGVCSSSPLLRSHVCRHLLCVKRWRALLMASVCLPPLCFAHPGVGLLPSLARVAVLVWKLTVFLLLNRGSAVATSSTAGDVIAACRWPA